MHSLPLFHRIGGTRVVVVGDGDMADAKRRLVTRAGGECCGETQAHQAQLAFVALEDEREAERVAHRLKRQGLLVNVADQPGLCDFTLPSVLDRDPVLVAVSTGGASAGLAKHLRLRLERLLPQSLGALASALAASRDAMRARWSDGDTRRRAVDALLSEGGALDPFDESSAERVHAVFADGSVETNGQVVHDFALSSDDPDDLTLRQARLLGQADHVLHDAAIPEAILVRARADAARVALPADAPSTGMTVILRSASE